MAGRTETITFAFKGNVASAVQAFQQLFNVMKGGTATLQKLQTASGTASVKMTSVAQSAKTAGAGGQQGASGLGALLSAILKINPSTIIAALGLAGLVKIIRELSREIVGVVDKAQTLEISLTTLAAKELVAAGMFETIDEAMGAAGIAAGNLIKELDRIGLVSPYLNEQVVETYRLSQTYGWAADQSLSLTRSLLDMSAALGKTGYDMTRISTNLGQIRSKGKIVGQELRDLAGLGVNLGEILRSELNVSVEAFNQGLTTGKYTMNDLVGALDTFVSRNYGGAAQRMARTVQGVVNSFKDLKNIVLRTAFKPAVDRITESLAAGFDRVSQFLVGSGALERAGDALLRIVDFLLDIADAAMAKVGPALRSLAPALDVFKDVGYWMRQIGENLVAIGKMLYQGLMVWVRLIGDLLKSLPWDAMLANLRDTIATMLSVINAFASALRSLMEGSGQDAAEALNDAFLNVLTLMAITFDRFATRMFTWGWNIIVQLTRGIIAAANAVLVTAMNAIGRIIGWFLKPGSPPKKGPLAHIIEWGRGVFETFLRAHAGLLLSVERERHLPQRRSDDSCIEYHDPALGDHHAHQLAAHPGGNGDVDPRDLPHQLAVPGLIQLREQNDDIGLALDLGQQPLQGLPGGCDLEPFWIGRAQPMFELFRIQDAEVFHTFRLNARFLSGFPESRGDGAKITRFSHAPGKTDLSRVVPQFGGPAEKEKLRPFGSRKERDEYGALSGTVSEHFLPRRIRRR